MNEESVDKGGRPALYPGVEMTTLCFRVPKGWVPFYRQEAEARGQTLGAWLRDTTWRLVQPMGGEK